MSKIVVKFGGSNLRRKEDIQKIIEIIKRYNSPLVVVVSALYGITDILADAIKIIIKDKTTIINNTIRLLLETHHKVLVKYIDDKQHRRECFKKLRNEIETLEKILTGIHYLGEIPDSTEDLVLSYGERLSSLLLALILKYKKVECERVLPEAMGLITDGEYGNATVNYSISENKINKKLSDEKIYIIPGFYGISTDQKITIFGRGGSDYTAAAIARCQPQRSAGCVFRNLTIKEQTSLNLPTSSVGYLIDKVLRLKGTQRGDAVISNKHAAFIENLGKASAHDVVELIDLIKEKAKNQLGLDLKTEVKLIEKF